jgi:hypothetical protein
VIKTACSKEYLFGNLCYLNKKLKDKRVSVTGINIKPVSTQERKNYTRMQVP